MLLLQGGELDAPEALDQVSADFKYMSALLLPRLFHPGIVIIETGLPG
jgi:hypothetical protein